MPTHHNFWALLNTIFAKAKPETAIEPLTLVTSGNFPRRTRITAKKEEQFARHAWFLSSTTITAIRTAVNHYVSDSSRECITDESYSVKVPHGAISYGLIYPFPLGGYRKLGLFSFSNCARSRTEISNDLLTDYFMLCYFLENRLYTNFWCIYGTLVSMIFQITSNSMLNEIWIFKKNMCGGRRLLAFRSQF
jgi:hypothetical protein